MKTKEAKRTEEASALAPRQENLLRSGPTRERCGNMPKSTFHWLRARGLFPAPVSLYPGSRAVYWRESDVDKFIASRIQKAL